ncbi:unnamed protein product [Adineta ricciae]|uniref:Uncharacterized protein n=1 Tax=Adineta ricciae TaxID=249248 RepID=A0A813MDV3_ADIRI|nr:unnamed protein product [Adineta ricciae]
MKSPEYHGTGRFRAGLSSLGFVEESCGALSKMGYQLNASTQMKLNHNLKTIVQNTLISCTNMIEILNIKGKVKKQRQSRSTSKTSRIRKTASSTIIPLSTDTTTSRAAENTVQTSNSLTSLTSMLNSINDQLFNVDVSV